MGRTGSALLPLHGGRVPHWLASRMARLGGVMVEALVLEEGPHGVLRRLAHPFWFQALGCVMGMDWHSSGITTSVLGALKRGLAGREREIGLTVCGGRGRHSRRTPAELVQFGERTGVDGEALARTSRLVAKVDSALVQDGFDLYLHGFVVANDGAWTGVQQGMNTDRRQARRDHRLSEGVRRGASWSAVPLQRSGPLLPRAWRQGRPSLPRPPARVRPDHLGPQTGGRSRAPRAHRETRCDPTPRRTGAPPRIVGVRARLRRIRRRRAGGFARVRRPRRFRPRPKAAATSARPLLMTERLYLQDPYLKSFRAC